MGQAVYINLDGGELPAHLVPPGEHERIVRCESDEVELILLAGGMQSGAHSMAFFARLPGPGGKVAMIEMSVNNFLNAAAGIRGRLVFTGAIREAVDPQIVFSANREKRTIHFSAETALHSWEYTLPHAKAFWRQLKEMTQDL